MEALGRKELYLILILNTKNTQGAMGSWSTRLSRSFPIGEKGILLATRRSRQVTWAFYIRPPHLRSGVWVSGSVGGWSGGGCDGGYLFNAPSR